MNIKSLLLGSAVASVAFTGAQAADAIFVPEPEPMEYVRVCDVYGAGFFYIPGTETCLKIGGYARYQINWDEGDDGWNKFGRAQLTMDARSETEMGTLRGFVELWFNSNSGFRGYRNGATVVGEGEDAFDIGVIGRDRDGTVLRQAFIELGGLYMGIKTTLWDGDLSGEYDNLGYDSRVHTIGYNFAAANGVNVGLALEEYDDGYDYTPNVVGKVGITQGWGSVNVFAAYDATYEEWAAKAIAKIRLSDPLSLELAGAYSSGPSNYTPGFGFSRSVTFPFVSNAGYEWTAGAHLKYAVNDKLAVGFGGQYFADQHGYFAYDPATTAIVATAGGNNDWAVGAVIDYKVVQGLDTKLAINYVDGDSYDADDGNWNGFLRITRSF